jgi:hypothetical protein
MHLLVEIFGNKLRERPNEGESSCNHSGSSGLSGPISGFCGGSKSPIGTRRTREQEASARADRDDPKILRGGGNFQKTNIILRIPEFNAILLSRRKNREMSCFRQGVAEAELASLMKDPSFDGGPKMQEDGLSAAIGGCPSETAT